MRDPAPEKLVLEAAKIVPPEGKWSPRAELNLTGLLFIARLLAADRRLSCCLRLLFFEMIVNYVPLSFV